MLSNPKKQIEKENDKPFCCTHCGSENYIKYGKKNEKQIYYCKNCKSRFVDNLYFERIKADPKVICVTLDLYFKGISLRKISNHLKQFYDLDIHFTTVFNWIKKYIIIIDEYVRQFKPNLSDIWNVDEMMISINGDWFYLWNVIDDETRFHLASVVSKERKIADASKALRTAKKRSHNKRPMFVITDGLKSYNQAIREEFFSLRNKKTHIEMESFFRKYFNFFSHNGHNSKYCYSSVGKDSWRNTIFIRPNDCSNDCYYVFLGNPWDTIPI